MIRATAPLFVLLWSVVLGLQRCRIALCAVTALISGGASLVSLGELRKNTLDLGGVTLVLFSCVFTGCKWAVSQLVLQRPRSRRDCDGGQDGEEDGDNAEGDSSAEANGGEHRSHSRQHQGKTHPVASGVLRAGRGRCVCVCVCVCVWAGTGERGDGAAISAQREGTLPNCASWPRCAVRTAPPRPRRS